MLTSKFDRLKNINRELYLKYFVIDVELKFYLIYIM